MTKRLVQWDLLRTIAMSFVVVCHTAPYLGPIRSINTNVAVAEFGLLCDPVFFALSGYFAIRPLKVSFGNYLFKKFWDIVLPLFTYTLCVLAYNLARGAVELNWGSCIAWCYNIITGGYWFIPCLIPFLILAPFLEEMFSSLSEKTIGILERLVYIAAIWGIAISVIAFSSTRPSVANIAWTMTALLPPFVVPGGYFVCFCLGYFLRRAEGHITSSQFKALVAIGLVSWIACPVLAVLGYQRLDPSYLWFPATVAIFLLFSRMEFRGKRNSVAISFLARHSYAVYLLQCTTIDFVYGHIGLFSVLDGTPTLPGIERLFLQGLAVLLSYGLAVLIGFAIDETLVKLAKLGFARIARLFEPVTGNLN